MYQIKLSPYAKIFYTEWLLEPNSYRYNVSMDQFLYGDIDIKKLQYALKRYITQHVLLNSHIQEISGEPYWVRNETVYELEYEKVSPTKRELLGYVRNPFNLRKEPLYRFKLIRVSDGVYRFIAVLHHIVLDGSSLDNGFFQAITNYYNDENYVLKYDIDTQIKLLKNLEKKLSDNIKRNQSKYKKFWHDKLADVERINLNFLKIKKSFRKQKSDESYNPINEIKFSYSKKILAKLEQIKRKYGITPFVYGQSIFALLIHKYTGKEQFAISYPLAIKEGLDFIYGAQLNTNLIPYRFDHVKTILNLIIQGTSFFKLIKQDDIRYGYYPIANIIHESNKHLLDLCFIQTNFRNTEFKFNDLSEVEVLSELNVDSVPKETLLFEQELQERKLNYRVRYNKRTFDKSLLISFVKNYKKLFIEVLDDLAEEIDNEISAYDLLDEKEFQSIIYEYNKTNKRYDDDKKLHEWFEEQVKKTPNKIAVVYSNSQLTYHQLNYKANQLAHYLLKRFNIKPDDLIALCLKRNEFMIISILAVLKSGGAYVPLNPKIPLNRLNHIVQDANIKMILTNEKYQDELEKIDKNLLTVDSEQVQKILISEPIENPQVMMSSAHLAYVIYTSGSTGKPKGVLQQHNNVIRLFTATEDWYHFNDKDIWVLFHSYTFDFAVWEMWGALLYGGKLIIPTNEQIIDPNLFYDLCYQEGITVLNYTPKAFYQFLDVVIKQYSIEPLSCLRYVIFGGDELNYSSLYPWFKLYGYETPRLINMYGITETTVHVTYKAIERRDLCKGSCIGRAIPDQKLYILDSTLKPLPLGAIGELYVGGAGLARGYLNLVDLTKKKFLSNPFQTEEEKTEGINDRIYKTGDLVRMLPNGELEYVGRNDSQVKIRGFRVELSEIEKTLTNYPGIQHAVVLAKEQNTGSQSIVAYYVAEKPLDETDIDRYLATQLPDYMLPSIVVYLNELPLNVNGKIKVKALPEPIFKSKRYASPENEREQLICKAFSQVLKIKRIGINDDFFTLGGDSLDAIRLTSVLQANFFVKVADIFAFRTPKNIAKNTSFGHDTLKRTLENIKKFYDKNKKVNNVSSHENIDKYLNSIQGLTNLDFTSKKNIKNVLLTGATGYLGCNILYQLLKLTNYNVFVLVRANNQQEAFNRVYKKFKFYFDGDLNSFVNKRLFVVKADLEKNDLDLLSKEYKLLTAKIDSIIHAAALVKHYGDESIFYSANVQATINLLEMAKLTRLKDFHYISTISVLDPEFIPRQHKHMYTEDDSALNLVEPLNIYSKTKLQAEYQAIKYREYGVKSNIYRVGNLAFISENFRAQENIEDNAFFNWLKCLLSMNGIAEEIGTVEVSQADLVAKAIVMIFDKDVLNNGTYHVFNPYLVNLARFFSDNQEFSMKVLPLGRFIKNIFDYLLNDAHYDLILKFLLRQGWLEGQNIQNSLTAIILQDKTRYILKQLNFEWMPITDEVLSQYIESCYGMENV